MDRMKNKLRGVNAINATHFDESGNIDFEILGENIDFLIQNGIEVIYPCGNTGEFYSLTTEEAKEVTKFVVQRANKRAAVIAGVGYGLGTAIELAKNAESAGADGIMIHHPISPFILPSGIIEYYARIAASTQLPVVLYIKNPVITPEILREVCRIDQIIGVKFSVNDLPLFSKTVQMVNQDVVWICGTAEMWAPFYFAGGAEGFTSGLVNVDAKRSIRLLQALQRGNHKDVLKIWEELRPFEELRANHGDGNNVSVVKEAMHQLGLSNGIVRPPIASLTEEEKQKVSAILKSWGLL